MDDGAARGKPGPSGYGIAVRNHRGGFLRLSLTLQRWSQQPRRDQCTGNSRADLKFVKGELQGCTSLTLREANFSADLAAKHAS
ncbi:hypothetical protein IFM89_003385 [Coptis chinensis]|uniref:Uncharacterized protein n=1 Tax=Coptis chinensis TaxID=261450 RepID=A0A835ITJ8_9MAGN|nr:hypothetical protein IFM89_003385 [Coptis chinensis]